MKKSTIFSYAVMFLLATSVFLPGTSILAQTNFVKYASNPVLPLGNPGEWDDTEAAYAHISFDGAVYKMWYSGAPEPELYRIGYATSVDGINWIKDITNPVLGPGNSGDFDDAGAWQPMVLFNGNKYEMWYEGNLFIGAIGYATSVDGISWDRNSGNPVLARSSNGWDQNRVANPVVIIRDTLYQMWYAGESSSGIWHTGYATSTDGVNWSKHSGNPVLPAGEQGEWDSGGAVAGSVLFEDGLYQMWYFNWTSSITGLDIGYATSPDGINWTKHQGNPILSQEPGDWDAANTYFPRVIKEGNRYRMWYTGRRSGTIDRLCYAEDFSNAAHVDSVWAPFEPVIAGLETANIWSYISNPHNDELTVRAIIKSEEKNINTIVNMSDFGNGRWHGSWAVPAAVTDYVVGIELTNHGENYIHNSYDWGVFDEFRSTANPDPLSYTFSQIANIDDGEDGGANKVTITDDGIIFLANGQDGLRAYTFDCTSFSNIAHVNDGGDAMSITEASDGTLFLANGEDGLRAYSFDGTDFTNLAHIDEGGSAMDVAVVDDETIFLANGADGLRAYSFDGNSFVSTAHLNDFSVENEARGIAVAPDNTIFLFRDGVWAYNYTGSDFINTWHNSEIGNSKGIAFRNDDTIFLGSRRHVHAFSHEDTSFVHLASDSISELWPQGITAVNELIFIAGRGSVINNGVLAACSFDGISFHKTAYLSVDSRDIALWSNDTLLVASGNAGLIAYSYSPISATSINDRQIKSPEKYRLFQNYPNPFNPTTIINYAIPTADHVEVKIYNVMGQEIRTLVNSMKPAGTQQVVWDGMDDSGNIVPSGVYFYQLQAGTVVETRKMLLIR